MFNRSFCTSFTEKLPGRTIAALVCALAVGVAPAAANDTMDVLLQGHQLQVTSASGAIFTVTFSSNGQYQASTGSSGSWTMTDNSLCTTRVGATTPNCGLLPAGKVLGDSWQTTDGNGNAVTASII